MSDDDLFVQKAFPFWGYPASGSWHRLFRRMRARIGQLRSVKSFSRSVIVEPVFAGLKAIDDRVARGRVVLRRMLAWRSIAATNVDAFGTSAQMQPPSALCKAFDTACAAGFRVQIDSFSFTLHARSFLSAILPATSSRSVPPKRSMEFWAARDHTHCMTSGFLN